MSVKNVLKTQGNMIRRASTIFQKKTDSELLFNDLSDPKEEGDKPTHRTRLKSRSNSLFKALGVHAKDRRSSGDTELFAQLPVGTTVSVLTKEGRKPGLVMWFGSLQGIEGFFYGIRLNAGEGLNNGVFKEERHFVCPEKTGVFSRPQNVTPVVDESQQLPADQKLTADKANTTAPIYFSAGRQQQILSQEHHLTPHAKRFSIY